MAYAGRARVGGQLVIELVDCLGPMLPVADFDDPAALAARLELRAHHSPDEDKMVARFMQRLALAFERNE